MAKRKDKPFIDLALELEEAATAYGTLCAGVQNDECRAAYDLMLNRRMALLRRIKAVETKIRRQKRTIDSNKMEKIYGLG